MPESAPLSLANGADKPKHTRSTNGCMNCRLLRKRCPGPQNDGSGCLDCASRRIACLGFSNQSIPRQPGSGPELPEHQRCLDLMKRWASAKNGLNPRALEGLPISTRDGRKWLDLAFYFEPYSMFLPDALLPVSPAPSSVESMCASESISPSLSIFSSDNDGTFDNSERSRASPQNVIAPQDTSPPSLTTQFAGLVLDTFATSQLSSHGTGQILGGAISSYSGWNAPHPAEPHPGSVAGVWQNQAIQERQWTPAYGSSQPPTGNPTMTASTSRASFQAGAHSAHLVPPHTGYHSDSHGFHADVSYGLDMAPHTVASPPNLEASQSSDFYNTTGSSFPSNGHFTGTPLDHYADAEQSVAHPAQSVAFANPSPTRFMPDINPPYGLMHPTFGDLSEPGNSSLGPQQIVPSNYPVFMEVDEDNLLATSMNVSYSREGSHSRSASADTSSPTTNLLSALDPEKLLDHQISAVPGPSMNSNTSIIPADNAGASNTPDIERESELALGGRTEFSSLSGDPDAWKEQYRKPNGRLPSVLRDPHCGDDDEEPAYWDGDAVRERASQSSLFHLLKSPPMPGDAV